MVAMWGMSFLADLMPLIEPQCSFFHLTLWFNQRH